jgi:hypothetical protein
MTVRTNLVPNPSFEISTSGWSPAALPGISDAGATLTRAPGALSGQLFRAAVSTGATGLPQGVWADLGTHPAGTVLTFSALVWQGPQSSLPPISCLLRDMTSGAQAEFSAPAGEVPVTAQGTLTVGAQAANVRLAFLAPAATTFHIDTVIVQIGPDPAPYFDGSTPDTSTEIHAWTGTPHASASVAYPPPTITAAPSWGYRTTITTQVEWGVYSVYRLAGGTPHPVRGGHAITGSTVLIDSDVDLNRPVTYLIRDTAGRSFTSAPISVPATRPVLSDPATGDHTLVTIVSWPKRVFDPQSKPLWPHSATAPTVVVAPEHLPQSSPTLLTLTRAEEHAVHDRAATGRIVLLRPSCPQLDPAHLLITGRDVERATDRIDDESRLHHLDAQHVLADLTTPAAGDTLGDLHQAVPTTLGAIHNRWATLGAIAAANLKGGS